MAQSKTLSLPPLRALRVFATLARFDRHSDAAKELGVSTSAISQQIKALETWFGTELFEPRVRAPKLTAIGETLRDAISAPLTQIESSCHAIRRSSREAKIVVSAPAAYLSHRLIPRLDAFWKVHPNVEVDVRVATRFDAPPAIGEVDLAIRFIDEPGVYQRIGRPGWSAFCRPELHEALGRPQSIEQLAPTTLLHEAIYNFWPEEYGLAGLKVPPEMTFRPMGDANLVLSAVLAGGAVALLPAELGWPFVRQGTLVSLFRAKIERDASYVAIRDPDRMMPDLDALLHHISEL
ncbi:MAG: LysR substrate-binding domain-containing protein [Pseudomonadota bacterium]